MSAPAANPPVAPAQLPAREMTPANILITGGSKGLGLGMVRHFLKQASTKILFAACRDPSSATDLIQLKEAHPNLHIVKLEVTNGEHIAQAVEEVGAVVGDDGLNLLINNAGVATKTGLKDTKPCDITNDFATNAVAPFAITQAFLPLLQRAAGEAQTAMSCDRAAVINIGAGLGCLTLTDVSQGWKWFPYRISKAALHMVSRCLSYDLAEMGILTVAIHPGWVQTSMGGSAAHLTINDSISGVTSVLSKLNETHKGLLIRYDGTFMPDTLCFCSRGCSIGRTLQASL